MKGPSSIILFFAVSFGSLNAEEVSRILEIRSNLPMLDIEPIILSANTKSPGQFDQVKAKIVHNEEDPKSVRIVGLPPKQYLVLFRWAGPGFEPQYFGQEYVTVKKEEAVTTFLMQFKDIQTVELRIHLGKRIHVPKQIQNIFFRVNKIGENGDLIQGYTTCSRSSMEETFMAGRLAMIGEGTWKVTVLAVIETNGPIGKTLEIMSVPFSLRADDFIAKRFDLKLE